LTAALRLKDFDHAWSGVSAGRGVIAPGTGAA
jgi:hypothetical protein